MRKCDHAKWNFWTKSGLSGKLMPMHQFALLLPRMQEFSSLDHCTFWADHVSQTHSFSALNFETCL
jgi:hypothetical protein